MRWQRKQNRPAGSNFLSGSALPAGTGNILLWVLALGGFLVALASAYRQTHPPANNWNYNLRTPGVLALNAFLASALAIGYAFKEGEFARWTSLFACLRFGLWATAVFHLLSPSINEEGLFLTNSGTFDAPYVILGACIHGGLAALIASPFAVRALYLSERRFFQADETSALEMCGATILVFYIVTGIVRLLAWGGH